MKNARSELVAVVDEPTALSFKIALHSQRLCYFIVGRCPDGQNYIFDY